MTTDEDSHTRSPGAATEVYPPGAGAWLLKGLAVIAAILLFLMVASIYLGEHEGLVAAGLGLVVYAVGGVWAWRRRKRPLVIEKSGAIRYGERRICEVHEVRRVVYRRNLEGVFELWLELADERAANLPVVFSVFCSEGAAEAFAQRLSKVLNAPVSNQSGASNCD